MRHPPDVSIVIPCYRSEQTLPDLTRRIQQTMSAADATFEIVLVEDGSPDGTWNVIRQLARLHPFIRGIRQMLALGIMGEYLARIHVRTTDRSSLPVDSTTDEGDRDAG